MLRGAVGRPVGCRCQLGSLVGPSLLQVPRLASFRAPRAVRLVVSSSWNPFDKSKGKDGSSDAGKQDAARKALESLGKKGRPGSKPEPTPPTPPAGSPKQGAPGPSFSFGGAGGGGQGFGFGGGGGGGGGGGQGGAPQGGGDNEAEKPILTELKELFWGMWVVGWNAAAFLLFACFLHRSLPWFVQTELLIAVGAPQQAMERFFGVFFDMLEWVEKHLLGWDIPDENAGNMRMFEVIRDYDPPEAAYTFAQYRYPLTGQEQDTLLKAHAVKSFERRGGYAGDVDPRDVQAIYDKYEPQEADRRAYREAVKSGTVAEYRASKAAQAQAAKYQDYLNPRGAERAAAAAAAAAAGGSAK